MPQTNLNPPSNVKYDHNGEIKALFITDLKYKDRPWGGSHLAPLTVQFTDTSLGNPDKWYWDFGDDIFSREQNPIHTYYGPITTVKMWAWKNDVEKQHVWSDWDRSPGTWRFAFGGVGVSWNVWWYTVKAMPGVAGSGMTCYRKAKVSPSSISKEVTIAYCTLPQDLTGYGSDTDTFLTLLQTDENFNNVTHWDYTGNAPAVGMTVSIFDSGLSRIISFGHHRDFNIALLGQTNVCLGDVGNQAHHPGREVTSITFVDFHDDPWLSFEQMPPPPDWPPAWPSGLGNSTGYKVDAFQTMEILTFTGDDWGWIEYDFDDYPFDFYGTPRSGITTVNVQFTDLSVLSITEWDWDFGDGTVKGVTAGSTHQHPLHTYTYD